MILTVIFQLSGAIILGLGLAFRNKRKIYNESTSAGILISDKVPSKIKDLWEETFLCRYGIILTVIGYIVSVFEPQYIINIWLKITVILIFTLTLVLAAKIIAEHNAEVEYRNTHFEDVKENMGSGGLLFRITESNKD